MSVLKNSMSWTELLALLRDRVVIRMWLHSCQRLEFERTCSWKVDLSSVNHVCLIRVESFLVTCALTSSAKKKTHGRGVRSHLVSPHLWELCHPFPKTQNRVERFERGTTRPPRHPDGARLVSLNEVTTRSHQRCSCVIVFRQIIGICMFAMDGGCVTMLVGKKRCVSYLSTQQRAGQRPLTAREFL